MTECKFCGKPIRWDTATGKPLPFNLDGSRHDCRSQNLEPSRQAQQLGKGSPVGATEQKPLDQKPEMKAASTLDPAMEAHIRLIVNEELRDLFRAAADRYEKAKA